MSKVIYVAGPYRAAEEYQKQDNIRRAEEAARKIWQAGDYAICPHLNTRLFGGLVPDEQFLAGGLELLRRSDGVFLLPGWRESEGAQAEVEEAKRLGLPLYHHISELREIVQEVAALIPEDDELDRIYITDVLDDH